MQMAATTGDVYPAYAPDPGVSDTLPNQCCCGVLVCQSGNGDPSPRTWLLWRDASAMPYPAPSVARTSAGSYKTMFELERRWILRKEVYRLPVSVRVDLDKQHRRVVAYRTQRP